MQDLNAVGLGFLNQDNETPSAQVGAVQSVQNRLASVGLSGLTNIGSEQDSASLDPANYQLHGGEIQALGEIKDLILNNKVEGIKDIGRTTVQAPARIVAGTEKAIGGLSRFMGNENSSPDSIYGESPALIGIGKDLGTHATERVQTAEEVSGKTKTYVGKIGNMISDSIGTMIPALATGILTGGVGPAVDAAIFLPTFGNKMTELLDKGVSMENATARAAWEGVTEAGTERIGFAPFLKLVQGKGGFKKFIWSTLTKEVPTEHIATALQNSMDEQDLKKGMFDPSNLEKSWDYLASKKHASDQIDTFFTTLGMSAGFGGIHAATSVGKPSTTAGQEAVLEDHQKKIREAQIANQLEQAQGLQPSQFYPMQQPQFGEEVGGPIYPQDNVQPSDASTIEQTNQAIVDNSSAGINEFLSQTPSQNLLASQSQNPQPASPEPTSSQIAPPAVGEVTNIQEPVNENISQESTTQPEGSNVTDDAGTGISNDGQPERGVQGTNEAQGQSVPNLQGNGSLLESVSTLSPASELAVGSLDHFNLQMADPEKGSVVESASIPESMAHLFESLTTKLGFKSKTILMTSNDLESTPLGQHIQELFKQASGKLPSKTMGGKFLDNLVDPISGKTFHVAIVNDNQMGNSTVANLVALHEAIGHGIFFEFFKSASIKAQDAVKEDFDKFFKQAQNFALLTPKDRIEVAKLFVESGLYVNLKAGEAVRLLESYIATGEKNGDLKALLFKEWFANKAAQAVLSNKRTPGILGKFWSDFAEKIKELYSIFKEHNMGIATGVESIEDYVEFLFKSAESAEKASELSIENFNIKLSERNGVLISAVVNSMLSVKDGKVTLNPSWLLYRKDTTGKLSIAIRKFMARYKSKEFGYTSEIVRSAHANESGYKIVSGKKQGKGEVWYLVQSITKMGVERTEILFSLSKDKWPNIKGIGPSNTAYAVMQNIRDAVIIADFNLSKPKEVIVDKFLQSADGTKFKIRIPEANKKLQTMLEASALRAYETGLPTMQIFTEMLNGKWSYFSDLIPGIRGTSPMTSTQADKTIAAMRRDISIMQKEFPNLYQMLYPQGDVTVETVKENELVQEIKAEEVLLPSFKASSEAAKMEVKVADLVQQKQSEKRRKAQGPLKKSEIIEFVMSRYLDDQNRDSTELPVELANFLRATAEEMASEITGEQVVAASKLQNDRAYIDAIRATESGVEFSFGDNGESDLRVLHGTSSIIPDVPDIAHAQPGLFGKGIYTTEDYIDPKTGHAIVTEGYSSLDQMGGMRNLKGNTEQEKTESALAFETAINNLMHTRTQRDKIIADRISKEITGTFRGTSYLGAVGESIAVHMDVLPLIKNFNIYQYIDTVKPNILPLEINPDPKRTLHLDSEVKINTLPQAAQDYLALKMNNSETYIGLPDSMNGNILLDTLTREIVKDNRGTGLESNEVVRQKLVDMGFDFLQHKGGVVTGGVSHKVWVALKDGLIKSAFDHVGQMPSVAILESSTENGTHFNHSIEVGGQVVGQVELVKKAKTWRISNIEIPEEFRGKKIAQATYLALAKLAKQDGKVLKSDMKNGYMSTDAVRAWRALARKGLAVEGMNSFKIVNIPNFGLSDQASQALVDDLFSHSNESDLAIGRKAKARKMRTTGDYADILKENPKVKKVRVKKPIDPVKVQAKKDALIKFIEDMTVQKNEADRKGISLFEQLKSTGLDNKKARLAVGKFNSNVSRFSQTEIIFRLANHLGLVNQDGREALENLIKTIFKPIPKLGQDASGAAIIEVEEGSDGTVESLGTAGKDILIARLQTLVVAKEGSIYRYDDEKTLWQLKSELHEAEQARSSFKWTVALLHWFQSDGVEQLSTTKIGRELVYRLKKFLWRTTDYQRDYLFQLNDIGQVYKTEAQREYLYSLLTGENQAKNQMETDFISLIEQINLGYSREMEVLQVKIQHKSGKLVPYKHDSLLSKAYFPHMWEPGAFEKKNEAMIQSLLDSGEAANRQHALNLMKQFKNDYIRSQKFANIERARETDLGGWMTDPIKVYQKYVTQTSKRLAQLREFGATPELALAQFAIGHFKEGSDSKGLQKARDLINQIIGVRVEEDIMQEPKWGATAGIMYSTGLLLQHAVFVQPGTATNMAMVGGIKNLSKSLVPGIKLYLGRRSPEYQQEWLKVVGSLAFTMNKELYDIVLDDKTREKSDRMLRTFGVTQVDSMMRIVGALTGKLYAVELATDLASGKDTPKQRELLKRLGLDPASILSRETPGVLTERELRLAGLAFAEETNFVSNPLTTPFILKNHPLGRIFFLFSRFAFQQHHLWKTVLKDSKGKALKGILAGMTVGTPMMLLKMILQGDDPWEVLKKDGVAKLLWKAFCTGSGPGLYFESLGNAMFTAFGKSGTAKGTGMVVDSPMFGLAETVGKGAYGMFKVGYGTAMNEDISDGDVSKAGKGAVALAQIALIKSNNLVANAAVGMTRPLAERLLYPTTNQAKTTYLRR